MESEPSRRESPASPSIMAEADVRAELQRILSSPVFASQDRLQKFLSYVVSQTLAGHAAELKEITIGFEVFARRADYDVKVDSIVRVQARRLRDKLSEYYESPASARHVLIVIPKGGYVPEFTPAGAANPAANSAIAPPDTPSSASPADRRRFAYFALGAILTITIAALLGWKHNGRDAQGAVRIRPFLGGSGSYNHPAFSPDGSRIAFNWDGPNYDNTDIYVQSLDSDTPVRLTTSPVEESRAAWSPDGNQLAFLRRLPNNRAAIVLVPAQGGQEKIVSELSVVGDMPRIDWSPDGSTLVTSQPAMPHGATRGLVLISISSGSQRVLTSPQWGSPGDGEAAFSPNGSLIAFVRANEVSVVDLFTIPAAGGDAVRLTSDNTKVSGLSWTPDSKSLVFGSARGGDPALWRVPARGGPPVRLAATMAAPAFPSVARHGGRIAFAVRIQDENIWRLDLAGGGAASRVIESSSTDISPALSPDGSTLAFRSSRTGHSEVWLSDTHGGSAHPLTHAEGVECGNPDWSPDGLRLAYELTLDAPPHVYIISRNGGASKRLTSDTTNEIMPHWSRDGRSIYYASNLSGRYEIWRKALEGGPAVQITHEGGYSGQESFDGRVLFFTKGVPKSGLWRQPLDGGPEVEVAPQLPSRMWGNWRVAKDGVYFLSFLWEKPFVQNLYFYHSATQQVRLAAHVPGIAAPFNAGLAVSPDERSVFFVQVDRWGVGIYFAEELPW